MKKPSPPYELKRSNTAGDLLAPQPKSISAKAAAQRLLGWVAVTDLCSGDSRSAEESVVGLSSILSAAGSGRARGLGRYSSVASPFGQPIDA